MLETLAQIGLAMIAISIGLQIAIGLFIAAGFAWGSVVEWQRERKRAKMIREFNRFACKRFGDYYPMKRDA